MVLQDGQNLGFALSESLMFDHPLLILIPRIGDNVTRPGDMRCSVSTTTALLSGGEYGASGLSPHIGVVGLNRYLPGPRYRYRSLMIPPLFRGD